MLLFTTELQLADTTDLAVLLRRQRFLDLNNPGQLLPEDRVSFDSQLLILPPALQPAVLHGPGYLLPKMNVLAKNIRRSRLDRDARRRWNKELPKPADGSKINVAFVRALGTMSGGKGYGRNAAKGAEDAEIRALRSMPWIDLVVVRTTENYTSKICSKPGCGAS